MVRKVDQQTLQFLTARALAMYKIATGRRTVNYEGSARQGCEQAAKLTRKEKRKETKGDEKGEKT
jgi:hypothetical protein